MASKVVLQVFPREGTKLAKLYTPSKMAGREFVPLPVLSKEQPDQVVEQIRDRFRKFPAARAGSVVTAIRLEHGDDPVKKPLSAILDCARDDDPALVELCLENRTLPIYVDFEASSPPKGERCHPHMHCLAQAHKLLCGHQKATRQQIFLRDDLQA